MMNLIKWIVSKGVGRYEPNYDRKESHEKIERAKMIVDRTDRLYASRTGHPVGDVIDHRRPPITPDRGIHTYATHH